ncbi:MAG: 2-oxo acid dehydrogenase subunit E2 [Bryobacteraceae bacterium]|nr:2-oxo acid dehydrogenase subunit E2 [Bryobacteraceae bacterium]
MPKPGITVEECLLVGWKAAKGDRVTAGQAVAEIETDKAGFDVEAPVDGVLLETFFGPGELIPVFTNIAAIGQPGENYDDLRPAATPQAAESVRAATPTAPAPAREAAAQATAPPAPAAEIAAPAQAAPVVLSPRARRFAQEHGFFPARVSGSGPQGRVLESDLEEIYYRSPRLSLLAQAMIDAGHAARGEGSGAGRMILSSDLATPPVRLAGIRETIARRMRESLAKSAQYTLHSSADATALLNLRKRLKASGSPALASININDLVMRCAVKTLTEVPELNAELIDGQLYRHERIHIGFACDTPRGLVVPIVRDSQDLSLEELAARIHLLTDQALNGALEPDDMTGGTFTVSNLGSLGIESFTPVINPPQVAVLGVDAIQLKPARRGDAVEFVDYIGLSLTCDHQVIDGAPGARFLKKLRENVENIECTI